jgi:outer membrane protein assembly factor BamD
VTDLMKTVRVSVALAAMLLALPGCSTLSKLNPFASSEPEEVFDPTKVTPDQLYGRGIDALNAGNPKTASQQFELVDQNYPYSNWAVNAQLMIGFVAYKQQRYVEAISTLDRFIQLHPSHRDISYAYYLRALSYYEQITDIKRDQRGTQEAIGALTEVVNRFPDSAYGRRSDANRQAPRAAGDVASDVAIGFLTQTEGRGEC